MERPSTLGNYSYEVVDTKLARSPRARYIIQLCLYSFMVEKIQGIFPRAMHLILGDGTEKSFRMVREVVYQILDFHGRAAKPEWWSMFARSEMEEEELIDDPSASVALKWWDVLNRSSDPCFTHIDSPSRNSSSRKVMAVFVRIRWKGQAQSRK